MKVPKPILYAYILILLGAVYFFFSSYDQNKKAASAFKWVNHSHEVIQSLNAVFGSVTDYESHGRGFIISGDSVFLKASYASKEKTYQQIDQLRKLTSDNSLQQKNISILQQLVQEKMAFQDELFRTYRLSGKAAVALIASLKGKNLLDEVKHQLLVMQKEEQKILAQRISENKKLNNKKLLTNSVVAIIALVLFTIAFLKLLKENSLRRKVEAISKNNEEKYRGLIENSAVVIYATDVNGHFIYVSKKCEALTGYSPAELTGKHFTFLIDASWREDVQKFYANQFAKGTKETVFQFPIKTKEGDEKWVEQNVVMLFENSQPSGFQSIVKDITEKKITEDLLRQVERKLKSEQEEFRFRLQGILDNMPMLVYLKDLDGRFLLINQQFREVMGLTDEEVLGRTSFEVEKVKDNAQVNAQIDEEVRRTLKPIEIEYKKTTREGNRSMLTVKFPLVDGAGRVFAIGGFSKDITDLVEQREKLVSARLKAEQAERLQEEFLANMSHEIRTPMNGITGMTNLLMETDLSEQQKEFVKLIKQSSDTLLVIINDVLDLSKIKAGKMILEETDFVLNEVVDQVAGPMKIRTQAKGITLQTKIDPSIPVYLKGDPHKLIQVLNNLVSNAVKFTEKGGISINIEKGQETEENVSLNFTVTDSGIGIAKENLQYIFESFAQAPEDTTRKFGGTGLGLAITKKLIELQSGNISVDSVLGQGTQFRFALNYKKSNKKASQNRSRQRRYDVSFENKKLLLVEDNAINQKVILHILNKAGIKTEIAENGRLAIDKLESGKQYDFIIMDLQMPEMDGFQATTYIRKKLNSQTPIIAMTASALRNEKLRCFELGMNAYLTKPFVPEDLFEQLGKLYSKQRQAMSSEENSNNDWYDLSGLALSDGGEEIKNSLIYFLKMAPLYLEEIRGHAIHEEWSEILLKARTLLKLMEELRIKEMSANVQLIIDMIEHNMDLENIPALIKILVEQFALIEPMFEAELSHLSKPVV